MQISQPLVHLISWQSELYQVKQTMWFPNGFHTASLKTNMVWRRKTVIFKIIATEAKYFQWTWTERRLIHFTEQDSKIHVSKLIWTSQSLQKDNSFNTQVVCFSCKIPWTLQCNTILRDIQLAAVISSVPLSKWYSYSLQFTNDCQLWN